MAIGAIKKQPNEVFNDDGWFKSGDLGYIDDGFVYIVDRVKDMVIRGGENISCIEVETAIYAHPSVQEAAVFGIPEERLGETLCVAICLKPSMELSEQELKDFLQDKLAAFKIPSINANRISGTSESCFWKIFKDTIARHFCFY